MRGGSVGGRRVAEDAARTHVREAEGVVLALDRLSVALNANSAVPLKIDNELKTLRDDVRSWQGWYRNRVARVLVIFMLTNIGTMIGEWIGIVRIFGKLAG